MPKGSCNYAGTREILQVTVARRSSGSTSFWEFLTHPSCAIDLSVGSVSKSERAGTAARNETRPLATSKQEKASPLWRWTGDRDPTLGPHRVAKRARLCSHLLYSSLGHRDLSNNQINSDLHATLDGSFSAALKRNLASNVSMLNMLASSTHRSNKKIHISVDLARTILFMNTPTIVLNHLSMTFCLRIENSFCCGISFDNVFPRNITLCCLLRRMVFVAASQ